MATTTTSDAAKIYSMVLSELDTGCPVIVTDGTLTRKVVHVERVSELNATDGGTLDLLDENNNWWCIKAASPAPGRIETWNGIGATREEAIRKALLGKKF